MIRGISLGKGRTPIKLDQANIKWDDNKPYALMSKGSFGLDGILGSCGLGLFSPSVGKKLNLWVDYPRDDWVSSKGFKPNLKWVLRDQLKNRVNKWEYCLLRSKG